MSGGAPTSTNFHYNPEDARAYTSDTSGYNASQVGYNPNAQMQGSMNNLNALGGQTAGAFNQFGDMSSMAMNQAQGLMSGQSPLLQAQRQQMMQGLGDVGAQQSQGQNRMLAQRGLGGGGLRGAMGSGQSSALGEQARKGLLGIAGQGMQAGMGMFGQAVGALGQGVGALGQAGQMYGQAGGLASQQDARSLQAGLANQAATNQASQFGADWSNRSNMQNAANRNQASMFNAQAQNQATEYGKTGNYNQAMAQQAARNDFTSNLIGSAASVAGSVGSAKVYVMCIPEKTKIDTPNGNIAIDKLRTGDEVIGYDGTSTTILQKHEYKENPDSKRFLEITMDDNRKVNLCDMHRIEGIRSKNYSIGDNIGNRTITNIKWYDGVKTSYDLLTSSKGYRISEIPVNSMIGELIEKANELQNTTKNEALHSSVNIPNDYYSIDNTKTYINFRGVK